MQLRIMTEPQQGATYDDLLRVARAAEDAGYDAFFRSDHYQRIGEGDPGPGPTDAWVTLGALARETSTIRLGTIVTSATFRLPGPLAITVAQVDAMSGGRVELGLGSGWYEAEHASYGIPFPPLGERFERLEEQYEILTGLWRTPVGSTYDFTGTHYTLTDCPALPKPVQSPHPPLMVGGTGATRTPRLAARYAADYNVPFNDVDVCARQFQRVREACAEAGRDPASLHLSVAQTMAVGRDDAEVARRMEAVALTAHDVRAGKGLGGTVAEVVERIGAYAELGVDRLYCQLMDLTDIAQLELIAAEVAPQLG